jgi:hypothetical protein
MASTQVNTYFAKGNREGLVNRVADLFADDVPFMAMAEKAPCSNTKHEWQSDALASISKTGSVEGSTISYAQAATRTRHQNYCVIKQRNWDITFSQLAMTVAGVPDQDAREARKAMKSLMRDFEAIFLNTANSSAGTTSAARMAKGLQKAIVTNTAVGTGAGNSANIQLTEDNVNLLMQKIWNQGGDPKILFCGGHNKRVISKKFSAKTGFTWNIEASARKAIANVNQYEGSFGTAEVVPTRQHMVRRISIVTPELIKIAIYRDIKKYDGAQVGSMKRSWVEGEMTLEYGNEKGHAKHSYLKSGGTIA